MLPAPRDVWLAAEARGDVKAGDLMDDPPAAAVVNDRALIPHGVRSLLLARSRREDMVDARKTLVDGQERDENDARTLAAKFNRSGEHFGSWE